MRMKSRYQNAQSLHLNSIRPTNYMVLLLSCIIWPRANTFTFSPSLVFRTGTVPRNWELQHYHKKSKFRDILSQGIFTLHPPLHTSTMDIDIPSYLNSLDDLEKQKDDITNTATTIATSTTSTKKQVKRTLYSSVVDASHRIEIQPVFMKDDMKSRVLYAKRNGKSNIQRHASNIDTKDRDNLKSIYQHSSSSSLHQLPSSTSKKSSLSPKIPPSTPKKISRRKTKKKLTREEEISVTSAIRQLKSVIRTRDQIAAKKSSPTHNPVVPNHMYKDPIPKFPFKSQPTEKEWAKACDMSILELRRTLASGHEAHTILVSANIGLVLNVAKRYHFELKKSVDVGGGGSVGTILTLSDLVQEGNLGLMEAAERFDSTKGARFGTYATYWVKQRIVRSITNDSRVIRLPAYVHNIIRKIRKTRSDMEDEMGRIPSLSEIANRLEISEEKVQMYSDSSRSVLSLEGPIRKNASSSKAGTGDDDKRTLGERIAFDGPSPEEDAEYDSLKRDIRTTIQELGDEREREVLCIRFGLEDGKPQTLQETSRRLGISRERVRVIEHRALTKLRHPQKSYRLKDYIKQMTDDDMDLGFFGSSAAASCMNQDQSETKRRDVNSLDDYAISHVSPEKIWSF